jgi:hypothetical protein
LLVVSPRLTTYWRPGTGHGPARQLADDIAVDEAYDRAEWSSADHAAALSASGQVQVPLESGF